MLVPAPDHIVRAPGIEITVSASDDVCEPRSAQKDIGLGVMDVKSVSFRGEYRRFIVKNHIHYDEMVTPRWGFGDGVESSMHRALPGVTGCAPSVLIHLYRLLLFFRLSAFIKHFMETNEQCPENEESQRTLSLKPYRSFRHFARNSILYAGHTATICLTKSRDESQYEDE